MCNTYKNAESHISELKTNYDNEIQAEPERQQNAQNILNDTSGSMTTP